MKNANLTKKIIKEIDYYYNRVCCDTNDREYSWVHCYKNFYDTINDQVIDEDRVDYLSLHLAFYLSSWGMYRGSSFLVQKDYKIHKPAVNIILKYGKTLSGLICSQISEINTLKKIEEISLELKNYYMMVRSKTRGEILTPISDVLISKILLGTLACVPAYDEFFVASIRKYNIATGTYGIKSIKKLADFYQNNESIFESKRKKMTLNGIEYPQMKFLDMGLWQLGVEK